MTGVGVLDVTRSIAAHGLPGALSPWPAEPYSEAEWASLTVLVQQQRLWGLLVDAATSGALPLTPEQADQASELHFTSLCHVLLLESGYLQVVATLRRAGVGPRVLKGSSFAHLDYPNPSLRLFSDIDLIVRAEEFDAAVEALTAEGHVRHFPQPREGFDRRFSKGTSFALTSGLELDLHRTFVMGPYGLRLDLDDVWERSSSFELGGHPLQALDDDVRFLHACFHAALGDKVARLVPQRDLVQMLLSGRLDLVRVRALTARWGAEPVVARAVNLAWENLRLSDVTALSEWARHYQPSARALRELAVYHDDGVGYAGKQLAALRAIPRMRDKLAFAAALAFPDRAYVTDRHANRATRFRQALRSTRHRGAG